MLTLCALHQGRALYCTARNRTHELLCLGLSLATKLYLQPHLLGNAACNLSLPVFWDILMGQTALVRLVSNGETQTIALHLLRCTAGFLDDFMQMGHNSWAAPSWPVNSFGLDWEGSYWWDWKYFGNLDERLQWYGLHSFTLKTFYPFNPFVTAEMLLLL